MISKKIAFFIIVIASLFVINNLVKSISDLWQKKSIVENARMEVEEEKKRNVELKNMIKQVDDSQFVEEEARNKLFLSKPGEKKIILSLTDFVSSDSAMLKSEDMRPNWKKWWDLFF